MPPKLFRKQPPLEVYTKILHDLQISYHHWFCKEDLPMQSLDTWLPELDAYYLPCKAKRFLYDDFSKQRIITVLRHLSPCFQIELKSQERVLNGKKTTYYMVSPQQSVDLSGSNHGQVIVDFL